MHTCMRITLAAVSNDDIWLVSVYCCTDDPSNVAALDKFLNWFSRKDLKTPFIYFAKEELRFVHLSETYNFKKCIKNRLDPFIIPVCFGIKYFVVFKQILFKISSKLKRPLLHFKNNAFPRNKIRYQAQIVSISLYGISDMQVFVEFTAINS